MLRAELRKAVSGSDEARFRCEEIPGRFLTFQTSIIDRRRKTLLRVVRLMKNDCEGECLEVTLRSQTGLQTSLTSIVPWIAGASPYTIGGEFEEDEGPAVKALPILGQPSATAKVRSTIQRLGNAMKRPA